MMKKVAVAPANIAFIKYWGKINEELRLPANSSISMNLSEAYTTTSVEFDKNLKKDLVVINGKKAAGIEEARVVNHLGIIRKEAGMNTFAHVVSKNSFPKGTGMASSASGFAALTAAGAAAAGLDLFERELSILARIGSGSACRSIPDGIVEWKFGKTGKESYARSLYPTGYWDIRDVIAVIGDKDKKVSSSEGHTLAAGSPFYRARIAGMPKKVREIKSALKNKDFTKFGEIIEAEAINMHAVMMTSKPPLYYWLPGTLEVMRLVAGLREDGIEAYFTIDAGPNVHIICEGKNAARIKGKLKDVKDLKNVIVNKVAAGTRIIE